MACFWPLFASVGLIKLISNSSRQERFLKSFARYAQRFSTRTLRLCWSLILPGYVTKINQISLNCGLRLTSSCRVHALKCLREVVIVFSTRQLIIELRAYLLLKTLEEPSQRLPAMHQVFMLRCARSNRPCHGFRRVRHLYE